MEKYLYHVIMRNDGIYFKTKLFKIVFLKNIVICSTYKTSWHSHIKGRGKATLWSTQTNFLAATNNFSLRARLTGSKETLGHTGANDVSTTFPGVSSLILYLNCSRTTKVIFESFASTSESDRRCGKVTVHSKLSAQSIGSPCKK